MPPTAVFHVLALAKLVPQPPSVLPVSLPATLPTQLELVCLRAEMDSLSEPRLAILAIVTHQGASTARSKPGTLALDNLQFARLPSPQPHSSHNSHSSHDSHNSYNSHSSHNSHNSRQGSVSVRYCERELQQRVHHADDKPNLHFLNPTDMQSFIKSDFPSGPKPTVYCSQRPNPNLNTFDCLLITLWSAQHPVRCQLQLQLPGQDRSHDSQRRPFRSQQQLSSNKKPKRELNGLILLHGFISPFTINP